jgi:hypothetical protein
VLRCQSAFSIFFNETIWLQKCCTTLINPTSKEHDSLTMTIDLQRSNSPISKIIFLFTVTHSPSPFKSSARLTDLTAFAHYTNPNKNRARSPFDHPTRPQPIVQPVRLSLLIIHALSATALFSNSSGESSLVNTPTLLLKY